mmetsp:Transcript_28583/g.66225  ORF Transcript_28583/g.66225 Transcript_28583/m.66225 type:complete len:563 (-) Transcript_28583:255-1943(-)
MTASPSQQESPSLAAAALRSLRQGRRSPSRLGRAGSAERSRSASKQVAAPRTASAHSKERKESSVTAGSVFQDLYEDAISRMGRQQSRQSEKETREREESQRMRREHSERLRKEQQRYSQQRHSNGPIEDGFHAHLSREAYHMKRKESRRQRMSDWQKRRQDLEELAECTFAPVLSTEAAHRAREQRRCELLEAERRSLEDPPDSPPLRPSGYLYYPGSNPRAAPQSEPHELAWDGCEEGSPCRDQAAMTQCHIHLGNQEEFEPAHPQAPSPGRVPEPSLMLQGASRRWGHPASASEVRSDRADGDTDAPPGSGVSSGALPSATAPDGTRPSCILLSTPLVPVPGCPVYSLRRRPAANTPQSCREVRPSTPAGGSLVVPTPSSITRSCLSVHSALARAASASTLSLPGAWGVPSMYPSSFTPPPSCRSVAASGWQTPQRAATPQRCMTPQRQVSPPRSYAPTPQGLSVATSAGSVSVAGKDASGASAPLGWPFGRRVPTPCVNLTGSRLSTPGGSAALPVPMAGSPKLAPTTVLTREPVTEAKGGVAAASIAPAFLVSWSTS